MRKPQELSFSVSDLPPESLALVSKHLALLPSPVGRWCIAPSTETHAACRLSPRHTSP